MLCENYQFYSSINNTADNNGKDQVKRKQAKEFKAEWKKSREWLVYLPGNGMFCSLCQKYDLILYLWVTFDPANYANFPMSQPYMYICMCTVAKLHVWAAASAKQQKNFNDCFKYCN